MRLNSKQKQILLKMVKGKGIDLSDLTNMQIVGSNVRNFSFANHKQHSNGGKKVMFVR